MSDTKRARVAIVHDDLTQRGGAERVVLSLARLFPDAAIHTTIYDADGTYPEFATLDVRTTFLQRMPGRNRRALLPLYPAAVRSIDLRDYDAVISSTSRFAHGVEAHDAFHLSYCYNPPRFLYQADEYFEDGAPVPRWARRPLAPVLAGLRRWDQRAARRPDLYVGISEIVASRIQATYGRSARVIHPPLGLDRFASATGREVTEPPYYLVVARLLPYKRVDLAIRACNERGSRLVVVGSGPAERSLRSIAGPTIEFRARPTDPDLVRLLAGSTAIIQAGLEDFGFAPLEANASGRPAIAYRAGGACETVVDGVTGVLMPAQTVADLSTAMDTIESTSWDVDKIRGHAERFGEERFHAEILDIIEEHGQLTQRTAR